MSKVDKLLDKAIVSLLNSDEKIYLAKLAKNPGNESLVKILLALGEAEAVEYRPLVENFLTYTKDTSVPAIALQVLSLYWGFSADYLDITKNFIRGMEWDYDNHVKLYAIQVARGFFDNNNMDSELVSLLLDIFDDHHESNVIRKAAYRSLATMVGKKREELPSVFEDMDYELDVDKAVLKIAKSIVHGKLN